MYSIYIDEINIIFIMAKTDYKIVIILIRNNIPVIIALKN